MSTYESYTETPLPWQKQIPSHWSLLRNKVFFKEVKDTVGQKSSDYTLLSLTLNGIIPRDISSGKGKFPKDFDTYKKVTSGDMAFCLFDIDETPRTVGLSSYDGMLTGAYTVFHVSHINPRFVYYYYLALDNVKALRPLYSGLRKTIKADTFLGTKLPVPPREEQDHIARYLDWQISQINKLIVGLKKQIALLKEQKQVIISEAVTKGLDASALMKESGVDWIKEVPASWLVTPLKKQFGFGKGLPIKKSDLKTEGLSVISYGQVHAKSNTGVGVNDSLVRFVEPSYGTTNPQSLVNNGDFIFADTSEDLAGVGNCVYVDTNDVLFAGYHTVVLRAHEECNSKYFAYLFLTDSWRYQLRSKVNGVKVYSITKGILKQSSVIIPSSDEQVRIVKYLDEQCEKINTLSAQITREIETLIEYRLRLISDVVTGQIDVRGIEVPDFEYVADEVDEAYDEEESSDVEETEDE